MKVPENPDFPYFREIWKFGLSGFPENPEIRIKNPENPENPETRENPENPGSGAIDDPSRPRRVPQPLYGR